MTNKLDFYTELITSVFDSCCSYIVTLENTAIELISCYGNNPFDLDTLRLVVNNFDSTKKSFSVIDIKNFKNTVENEIFSSNNIDSIGFLPILDKNKIAIGYLITVFNQPFGILENQENTVSLITNKIAEQLRNDVKEEDLHIANNELLSQTDQKTKIVEELIVANKELTFQNAENEKRANELFIANQELVFQKQEQEKRAAELLISNLEINFLHQEEHALFASIVDSSDDAMLSKRLDGIITSWNHGAEKIFGYSADEIIGKSILTLIPPQLQHQEASIIDKIKSGETVSNLKSERLRKDGTIFYAALTISPIKNLDGDVIGASKVLRDITLQYNTEVEKNQLAERLRLATSSAGMGIWYWDNINDKMVWDEKQYQIYDIKESQFGSVYDGWLSRLHPEDKDRVHEVMQSAIADKKREYNSEFRIIWDDSSVHYIKGTGITEYDDNGNVIQMMGVNWDVTESKNAEIKLIENENYLRTILDNEPESVTILGRNGELVSMNPAGLAMIEADNEQQVLGYRVTDLVNKKYQLGFNQLNEAVFKGNSGTFEFEITGLKGRHRWLETHAVPLKDLTGKIVNFLGVTRDITERKKAEEKIKNNERQLNVIYNTVSDSFFMLSIEDQNQFKFISVNSTFLKTTGLNEEQIIGQYVHNVIPMPSLQMVLEKYSEAITRRSSVSWEETSVYPSGTKTGFVTVSPVLDEKNNCTILVGSVHDITERKRADNEMKSLTKRLLLATKSAQIGIWDWDIKNNLLSWDEGMYRLYSVAENEFDSVYEGWFSRLHPEDRQNVQDEMDLALDNKKDYKPEFRIVWGDSSVHYINASGIIERDNDGNAIRMIGVNWDITEQKEREQHLKLLESVITNTTDSILITEAEPFDAPGPRILYVNDAFTKMTGYTAADVIGKTPRILQGPKSDRAELKRLSEAIRKWETCEITTINYKKNGEEFWINFTLTPVANENGWYTHWIAIERDVTIRKNDELQNKLIADISTVFSEPLKLYETLDRALRFITNFGDFCFAEAWLTSSDQNILKKISSHAATENSRLFLEETISVDTSIDGDGFTGAVAKTREITIWGDLANQKLLRRRDAAVKYGLKTILGLPLLYNNELVGVLAFGLDHELLENNKYLSIFKKLGDYLGPEVKRKQLELELNQMFNFAPDLIVVIGLDGCFNRVNPAACQLLGYTQKELCAEPYVNFIHPEDREKSTNEIATLLETNLTYYFENRYITKSGTIKWLAWNAIYVIEDNNIYAVAKDITEKKELEDLLQKANELARIGGWEVDLQNNTILWSDITKEILEVAPDYIPDVQTRIDFYKKGNDRSKITEYLDQAINTGKSWDDEFQIVTAKGNERWVRNIGEAEFVNGNCVRIFGSFQDIHERKIIEQQKNILLTTLEKSLNEIYVFDAETLKFTFVNQGALLNNGYSEEEIKELTPLDIKPEFTEAMFNQLIIPLVTKEKEKIIFFANHQRKNGSFYPVEIHLQFVEEGNNKRFLAVILDITERKKAENKLIENENYLRTILDNEPECVKVLNSKGELISMNPAGLAMIEADNEQQVLGQRMTDLVHKEYQMGFSQLSAAVFKGNSGTFEFEITGLKGRHRWLETHVVPLKDTTGKIVNLLGVTRDITERKTNDSKLILLNENLNKQKIALVTSNKELEQFAYVASHDLQEPLRMVTSFLTLLEKRYVEVLDEKGLSYINFAVDGAKRMRQIILDILEFSRINTNHEGKYEYVDLKDIINDISLLQGKLIKEKKAKIIFEELPKVYSIRHYLMQLFQNIISNALKYSKEDVPLQIIIKSAEFDDSYQIAISDNGIGIEEEYFEKIFIIFQRLHGKEKYDGNGMGLAIVKKIVDKLNGKIWVESQIGVGSTFYINIPKK